MASQLTCIISCRKSQKCVQIWALALDFQIVWIPILLWQDLRQTMCESRKIQRATYARLHSFTLNAHKSFRYFLWKWPPKMYMMPSSETHVECPALSDGSLPFVRTLDHWRVSVNPELALSKKEKKKNVMRNVNIYLCARRKNKGPKSRCHELAHHHKLI